MDSIRIGIVGLGGICRQRHVPGLKKIAGVELVAMANRSRESGEQAAREFGIPEVAKSWEDIVGRDDLDAILIGTWPCMHRAVSMAALESGKSTTAELLTLVYQDVDPGIHAMAARSLLAGLIKLQEDGEVAEDQGHWRLSEP